MDATECAIIVGTDPPSFCLLVTRSGMVEYTVYNVETLFEAKRKAVSCGYMPTHWIQPGNPPIVGKFIW